MAKGKVIQRIIELKDKFTPGLGKVQKGTLAFKRDVKDLKKVGTAAFKGIAIGIAATGAAAIGAGVGFTALVNKTAEAADRIDKMSQRLGLSRQGFQELDFILDQNGVSIDSLGNGVKQFSKQLTGLQDGTKSSAEAFRKLGLDSSVAGLSQEEAFKKVVSAFQGMEEGHRKATLAQELFGRNGQEMLPMLNASKGSVEELTEKYKLLGSAMSDEAIANGVKFKDTLAGLKLGIKGMFQSLSSPALPHFTNGMQWLINKLPIVRQFGIDAFSAIRTAIDNNRDALNSIKGVYHDVKSGIANAFGSSGEGGEAVSWFIGTAIPGIIGGVASVLSGISNTYNFFRDNWSLIGPIVYGIVGALAAYYTYTKYLLIKKHALTAATWAWNVAMGANPIGAVVLGIGALIAVGTLLIKNWDDVKLAGMNTWNGIVGGVEWGVNAYIGHLNSLIDGALAGLNFLIKQVNRVPGLDIGELSFGIKSVDFGKQKYDVAGQEFNWGKKSGQQTASSPATGPLSAIQGQQNSKIDKLVASLDANTEATQGNTKAVKETLRDKSSPLDIADNLLGRIDRHLYGT